MTDSIEDELRDYVSGLLRIDKSRITNNSSFLYDLDADSLDMMDLTMAVQKELGRDISFEDLETLQTFGSVVEYIRVHKRENSA
jgi:acyl carrier protein